MEEVRVISSRGELKADRDLPSAVGVVGSGKGMTNYEQKKRAKFEEAAEE